MKKKGFTLVELLAVIVILAVIAIITVPMVLNVVEKARKNAFKDGIYALFSGVELYSIQTGKTVTSVGVPIDQLPVKNNSYKTGKIILNNESALEAVNVGDGRYCANGVMDELIITKGACDKIVPTLSYNIDAETKILYVTIKDSMGIDNYTFGEEDRYQEATAVSVNGSIQVELNVQLTEKTTYYVYVKDTTGEMTRLDAIEVPQNLFFENAVENQDYATGDTISWSDLDWYVLKDNQDSVTLILKNNYDIGIYGDTADWSSSIAKEKLNNDFLNGNEKLLKSKEEGSVIYNEDIASYVRLPYYDELTTSIPNTSETAFWTMSNIDDQLYLGAPNGDKAVHYEAKETGSYYVGYATTLADIEQTGAISVEEKMLSQNPAESIVEYNGTATIVNRSTAYAEQTNVSAANAYGYSCSNAGCSSSNAYCGARSQSYYGDTCEADSSFTYYVVQNWWNPNYNVSVSGMVCSSNKIYYANGECQSFYDITSTLYEIGYRPVVTVYKNR